ncbi:MAG: NAD(P)H-dependent oxidoreductase subunit E [Verrucomicrobiota bacterium]
MSIAEIVEMHGNARENLIEILHDIQDASEDNSLHKQDLQTLSEIMGLTISDLISTASFYTMFSLEPRGRHIVRLCESPPCYVMGSENLRDALQNRLGVNIGETTEDGEFTLETTSCLGACGVAPVMSVDDEVYGNLTEQKAREIIDSIATQC